MDLEEYARQVRRSSSGAALDSLARSGAGEKLAAGLDKAALEKAARAGDMQTLGRLLQGVLASPEGRQFAQQVRKAVEKDGR